MTTALKPSYPQDGETGACPACGAPVEMRGGVGLASCQGDCPTICQGMAIRIRVGDNPEFMLGSISPSFAPGATPQEMSAAIRAEMWKLLGAAANSFAAP